jgi:hypothetical protein
VKIEDEVASDLQREGRAMIFFYQRQCQVHAGGYSRRCIDVSVANEDWARIDLSARATLAQKITPRSMSRGIPIIERAGSTQQHRAGTH